jgi:hypothetical protein
MIGADVIRALMSRGSSPQEVKTRRAILLSVAVLNSAGAIINSKTRMLGQPVKLPPRLNDQIIRRWSRFRNFCLRLPECE